MCERNMAGRNDGAGSWLPGRCGRIERRRGLVRGLLRGNLLLRLGLHEELLELLERMGRIGFATKLLIHSPELVPRALQDEWRWPIGQRSLQPLGRLRIPVHFGETEAEVEIGGRGAGVRGFGLAQQGDAALRLAALYIHSPEVVE